MYELQYLLFSVVLFCSTPRWLLLSFTSLDYSSTLRCLTLLLYLVRFSLSYTAVRIFIGFRAFLLQCLSTLLLLSRLRIIPFFPSLFIVHVLATPVLSYAVVRIAVGLSQLFTSLQQCLTLPSTAVRIIIALRTYHCT